jgi:hypothetical protein
MSNILTKLKKTIIIIVVIIKLIAYVAVKIIIVIIIIKNNTNTAPQWIRTETLLTPRRVIIPLSYHNTLNIWRQYYTYK